MNSENDKIRSERLKDLRDKISHYSSIIGCSPVIQDSTSTNDGGFVDVSLSDYTYIYSERGQEKILYETQSLDQFVEFIMADKTWGVASDYELNHRIEGQDFRRQLFQKHIELLSVLSPLWAKNQDDKYKEILKTHPFEDK